MGGVPTTGGRGEQRPDLSNVASAVGVPYDPAISDPPCPACSTASPQVRRDEEYDVVLTADGDALGMSLSSLYRKIQELGSGLTESDPPRADREGRLL
jgi:hypothetical protein